MDIRLARAALSGGSRRRGDRPDSTPPDDARQATASLPFESHARVPFATDPATRPDAGPASSPNGRGPGAPRRAPRVRRRTTRRSPSRPSDRRCAASRAGRREGSTRWAIGARARVQEGDLAVRVSRAAAVLAHHTLGAAGQHSATAVPGRSALSDCVHPYGDHAPGCLAARP